MPPNGKARADGMRQTIGCVRHYSALMGAFIVLLGFGGFARAGDSASSDASSWREIETKYIFGFTTGSGIGIEGEKEFTTDTIGRFGKRGGRYSATETKYEFEFTPSQFVQINLGRLDRPMTSGMLLISRTVAKLRSAA